MVLRWTAFAFSLCLSGAGALAQTYPAKPVKIIVPSGAGGPTDAAARVIADRLYAAMGQPFIVENRNGAGGALGARVVATAPADGYTLLMGNTAVLATIPAVSKGAGYDAVKSFTPVALVMDSFQVVTVNRDASARTLADLVASAKREPGKLNYAATGIGNITHLAGELFKARAGVDLAAVQYRSGGEATTALLQNDVQMTIDNISAVRPFIEDGKLRALAVTSAQRRPELPDVPTVIEAGYPDLVMTSFFGVVAPAGTPPDIVDKLNRDINQAVAQASDAIARLGSRPAPGTPDQFRDLIANESAKWARIARDAKISID
ncbi:MAG: extra-cytoplasmic solute receptor protein [Hyphomicrobiales bacterium]|nr:extra-cytoplasmic solute receptor protein [Hyphomicrobiales bacterium]